MTAHSSRHSAAMVASLALHAAVAALLIGRGVSRLTLEPSPLVLTIVEASSSTAGPGLTDPVLREAAPAAAATAASPAVEVATPPEPVPAEVVPVANPRPIMKKSAPPKPAAPAVRVPAEVASAAEGSAPAAATGAGEGGHGEAARATAPAWAPTARVRYEELLFAWMNRHKDYPMLAQRRGIQGRGSLRVRIDRDGRVLESSVASSTGQGVLDEAALEMVRRANPFPAVPDGYAGSSFEFVAPVEYRLR